MFYAVPVCALMLSLAGVVARAENAVVESTKAARDVAPAADPGLRFWRETRPVWADKGKRGESHERYRTGIRSRWTEKKLYLLFICPYEELNLKPSPTTEEDTYQLWGWDVAEVFIGTDFQNIGRYKEFEMSPRGEWIDLDIDLTKPYDEDGWKWNSGFTVAARIDPVAKIWCGAMRIPFAALQNHHPANDETLRVNVIRSQGAPPDLVQIVATNHERNLPCAREIWPAAAD